MCIFLNNEESRARYIDLKSQQPSADLVFKTLSLFGAARDYNPAIPSTGRTRAQRLRTLLLINHSREIDRYFSYFINMLDYDYDMKQMFLMLMINRSSRFIIDVLPTGSNSCYWEHHRRSAMALSTSNPKWLSRLSLYRVNLFSADGYLGLCFASARYEYRLKEIKRKREQKLRFRIQIRSSRHQFVCIPRKHPSIGS